MEVGDKCICQENEWTNAFGKDDFTVRLGMRLVIKRVIYVAGSRFLSFEETPKDNYYLSMGFKPLRQFN